jgi:hypothetical protein
VRAGRVGASDPWCLTILISTIDLHDTQANYVFVRKRVVCPLMHEDIVRAMQETIYLGQDNGKPAFHQIVDHKETNHV